MLNRAVPSYRGIMQLIILLALLAKATYVASSSITIGALRRTLALEFDAHREVLAQVQSEARKYGSHLPLFEAMQQHSFRGHLDDSRGGASLTQWFERHNQTLPTYDTEYAVLLSDTLDTARDMVVAGLNPAVLNMANRYTPGGGVTHGSLAQEEEICRKSTLYFALSPEYNPRLSPNGEFKIRNKGYIYSPYVAIMKTRQLPQKNRLMYFPPHYLEEPYIHVGVVSAAMVDLSSRDNMPNYKTIVRDKIRTALLAPLRHGHDSVVLGAWGCGAFLNEPQFIAKVFKEELDTYGKYYKKVVFAIVIANDRDEGNFEVFQSVFPDNYLSTEVAKSWWPGPAWLQR